MRHWSEKARFRWQVAAFLFFLGKVSPNRFHFIFLNWLNVAEKQIGRKHIQSAYFCWKRSLSKVPKRGKSAPHFHYIPRLAIEWPPTLTMNEGSPLAVHHLQCRHSSYIYIEFSFNDVVYCILLKNCFGTTHFLWCLHLLHIALRQNIQYSLIRPGQTVFVIYFLVALQRLKYPWVHCQFQLRKTCSDLHERWPSQDNTVSEESRCHKLYMHSVPPLKYPRYGAASVIHMINHSRGKTQGMNKSALFVLHVRQFHPFNIIPSCYKSKRKVNLSP